MNRTRRTVLHRAISTITLTVAAAAGLLRPGRVLAAGYPRFPYAGNSFADTFRALSSSGATETNAIYIQVPDIAENGASVFIGISSILPDVDTLMVFVDRNPRPMIAAFRLGPGVPPALQTRIKIAQTSPVRVVARSAGRFYMAARWVKVTIGGCGAGVN